jgi:septal ring factor EnvC (AmiA/AmiB activator)
MNAKIYFSGILFSCSLFTICGCGEQGSSDQTHFTKADSLTETYLDLRDSMLETWNTMINDDNQKIKSMRYLLHELKVSNPGLRDQLKSYEEQLERLTLSRYTQKSMVNTDVVEEYDFASNSLVSELVSLAESQTQFAYNTTLQKLVEGIRTADQRVDNYRQEYDRIAASFNQFIDENKVWLKEIDKDSSMEKKPLFQMVAEENQQ